jgi:hypothetical protein
MTVVDGENKLVKDFISTLKIKDEEVLSKEVIKI